MLHRLWRWLTGLYRRLRQWWHKPTPTPPPPPSRPPISATELESTFLHLLDWMEQGASRGQMKGFLIAKGIAPSQWTSWLEGFANRLSDNPTQHRELARRMVQFGELYGEEWGALAAKIGREVLAQVAEPGEKVAEPGEKVAEPGEKVAEPEGKEKDEAEVWFARGNAQRNLGQYEGAIASFNEAIRLRPDFPEAYNNRGNAQAMLGQYEGAIASYNEAIRLRPDDPEAYVNRGVAQRNLGQYEEAIASFNEAIRLRPDYPEAYYNRGNAQNNLGKYEEAIASYNEAIRLRPDFPEAYGNRGNAQNNLGKYEEAIASFDAALILKRDIWQAWAMRGRAANQVEDRRNSPYLPSELALQNPDLNRRGFEGALLTYREGLKYCQKDTHPEGWGYLHFEIGNLYSSRSRREATHRHQDRQTAFTYYNLALETLTETAYPETHLEVLRPLIRLLLSLDEIEQAQELQRRGTDLVRRLVDCCPSPGKQRQLALQFADFKQLTVDLCVRRGEFGRAFAIAEAGKNACLSWLFYGRADAVTELDWAQMRQFLAGEIPPTPLNKGGLEGVNLNSPPGENPPAPPFPRGAGGGSTAAVYWHWSPYALTTFILKPDRPEPTVLNHNRFQDRSEYTGNLPDLEDWMEEWNRIYHRNPKDKKDKTTTQSDSWRKGLKAQLDRLAAIVQIDAILDELDDCREYQHLILIPHKDLHRLPLHGLFVNSDRFPDTCTLTYLPSAAFARPEAPTPSDASRFDALLSVENPPSLTKTTDGSHKDLAPLPAAEVESAIVARLFGRNTRLAGTDATAAALKAALQQPHSAFHFSGHGYYEFSNPIASALCLQGEDRLAVEEILSLDLSAYRLVYLSACETAVSSDQTITSEYVGLTSAFARSRVAYIVSTLWSVESLGSTLFALYFYQELERGHPEPVAFANAQQWLKTVTRDRLGDWYRQQIERFENDPNFPRSLLRNFKSWSSSIATMKETPFADPYYWSAFILCGR
ncbi:tetratricopeptide repeat protein [Oxynema sp. CENA135]|uniref:CHAT domain-containing protein n=1 Tax=Oxynema sp. CENA135 TaxID=984206 RepID=UPI00190BA273|nr:CHAT domain-containing tetratricopeptide repeat protein [Oxynema sp. CENA135]MBK4731306.1 tetratricopeptide repeat protein [Oxynema sp. CENA135]